MSGYHVLVESKDDIDERPAAEVARALCEAYPGHPWHVNIQDGLLIIKHLRMSAKWGMIRKYGIIHDAARESHTIDKHPITRPCYRIMTRERHGVKSSRCEGILRSFGADFTV